MDRVSRQKINGDLSSCVSSAQSAAKGEVWKDLQKSDGRARPASEKRQVRLSRHGRFAGTGDRFRLGSADFIARFASRTIGALRIAFYLQLFGFLFLTLILLRWNSWGHLSIIPAGTLGFGVRSLEC